MKGSAAGRRWTTSAAALLGAASRRAARGAPDPLPQQSWLDAQFHTHDPAYADWLRAHGVTSVTQWQSLRRTAQSWSGAPLISIVTPVCDPTLPQLRECIESMLLQAYPHWQLCLVDDASTNPDVLGMLTQLDRSEPRVAMAWHRQREGIVSSLNRGLSLAEGDYVAFLDHDDALTPDALYHLAAAIRADPTVDVVYSDRDKRDTTGRHHEPMLKPAWSPETLLSGNYLFHLLCYRRTLVSAAGGFRKEYEGSQDYDLALRVAERTDNVRHVPRVLYRWHEHEGSIAGNLSAKEYVFDAGQRALADALQRRGLTARVSPVPACPGHYRADLTLPAMDTIEVVRLTESQPPDSYRATIDEAARTTSREFLVVLGPDVTPASPDSIQTLASWLTVPGVGMTAGRVDTADGRIAHAGLTVGPGGEVSSPYLAEPSVETGYMAYAAALRNVSAPHPFCFAVVPRTWRELTADTPAHVTGPRSSLVAAQSGRGRGLRCVYVPYERFLVPDLFPVALWEDDGAGPRLPLDPFHPAGAVPGRSGGDLGLRSDPLPAFR